VGVPVVAADHGGPSELLGEAGLLVPPGDAVALAAAVDLVLADADLARRCGAAGRLAVEDHFNTAREQRELVATLDEVARRGR
jgi:glycosyltransferase involved in cell wall biosynthesis